jgi:LPS export ABC transporter protein LptC
MNGKIGLVLLCLSLLVFSCREDVDTIELQVYDGPINTILDIHLMHSDSAIVRSEIRAPKQLEFANGNIEFPEGIEIELFGADGVQSTTMKADKGYYLKLENIYKGVGNVQVKNVQKDQRLQAEELYWNPNDKKIYTETFVTIQERQTLFNGTGMEADESFTKYKLKNVRDSRTLLPGEGI